MESNHGQGQESPIDYEALYNREREAREAIETRLATETEARVAIETRLAAERAAREAAERRVLQERILKEQERQARLDAEASRSQLEQFTSSQALRPFLALVSRLQAHLPRLLPRESRGITLPVSQAASLASADSPATSTGQTSVDGMYYPRTLRRWTGFPALHEATFARIMQVLDGRSDLPPQSAIQGWETALLENVKRAPPAGYTYLDEARTSYFLQPSLILPASFILSSFLAAQQAHASFSIMTESRARRPADSTAAAGAMRLSSDITPASDSGPASLPSSAGSGRSLDSALQNVPLIVRPDYVMLVFPEEDEGNTPAYRVGVGEIKPGHALPHDALTRILRAPLSEQYMAQLAEKRRGQLAQARARKRAREETSLGASITWEPVATVETMAERVAAAAARSKSNSKPPQISKQEYFVYALIQTYHYMLISGVEFGFLSTGETLTLLRIPLDEPTTLLYHSAIFPAAAVTQASALPGPVLGPPALSGTDPTRPEELAGLPVSLLCTLCVLARESDNEARSNSWIADAVEMLAPFPQMPGALRRPSHPQSLPTQQPPDDDDNDDEDDDDDDIDDEMGRRPRKRVQRLTTDNSSQRGRNRAHTPSKQPQSGYTAHLEYGPDGSKTAKYMGRLWKRLSVVQLPQRLFCTQACLLGLVRGGPLDPCCPNVDLHVRRPPASLAVDAEDLLTSEDGEKQEEQQVKQEKQEQHHPISLAQLVELVRLQLFFECNYGIEGLWDNGYKGAIGYLFKISVRQFGYTFLGKGVQRQRRHRLQHESRIYNRLQRQQGVTVPVHLGLLKLIAPFPVRTEYTVLPYVLLTAYAGEPVEWVQEMQLAERTRLDEAGEALGEASDPLHTGQGGQQMVQAYGGLASFSIPLGTDLDHEQLRTLRELSEAGLYESDDNVANLLWSTELQRVVKIDFDRAQWDKWVAAPEADGVAPEEQQANCLSPEKHRTQTEPPCAVGEGGRRRRTSAMATSTAMATTAAAMTTTTTSTSPEATPLAKRRRHDVVEDGEDEDILVSNDEASD